MFAAGEQRLHPRTAFDPQRTGAFRAVELVRRERQQVDAEGAYIHGNFACRLHRIGVQQRSTRMGDRRQLSNWLNGADLVVRMHHRYDGRVVRDELPRPFG